MAAEILKLYVYYYDRREWVSPSEHGERKRIVITPSGPNAIQIKLDIAKVMRKIIKTVEKYYVTAEVELADGRIAYRSITKFIQVAGKRKGIRKSKRQL